MNDDADRKQLRQRLRATRDAIPALDRIRAAEAAAVRLLASDLFTGRGHVAGYWAVRGELPLNVLQARLPPGLDWCLPRLTAGSGLEFVPWRNGEPLQPNRFGIPEPSDPSQPVLAGDALHRVLVPLVGFDRRGNRLGSGAGFYDRSFAFLKGRTRPAGTVLIGVGFAAQEVDALAAAEWDVPLDYVVTEAELIECAR